MKVREFFEKAKPDSVSILWTYYAIAKGTPKEIEALGNEALLESTITDAKIAMKGGSMTKAGDLVLGSYLIRVDLDDENAKKLLDSQNR